MLRHDRLLQVLHYDMETGHFTWRVDASNVKAGTRAGGIDKSTGYVRLHVDGKRYFAQRLAWFYVMGEWPPADVDHRDRVRSNNAFTNLRAVTRAGNLLNQVSPSPLNRTSGVRGVCWDHARSKWKVNISVGNRTMFIGRFDEKEAAQAAYIAANLRRQIAEGMA